jgi:integrase/recombinase XerD
MAGGTIMKRKYLSNFSSFMERYLKLRMSMEYTCRQAKRHLYEFDFYLSKYHANAKTVTKQMVVGFLENAKLMGLKDHNGRLTSLRVFLRYLFQFDTSTYIPEKSLAVPYKVKTKPHIYTRNQVLRLLEAAKLLPPDSSLRPYTYYTIIGLLWVTGLRIGEVVRLNVEDVDLRQGLLYIKKTKFSKSRIVPISKSSTNALCMYWGKRMHSYFSKSPTSPFFVNERKKRCNTRTIHSAFHNLVLQLNLRTAQDTLPRLHDFRHSFATLWISDLYRLKKDPNAYLPVLATYLGHAHISNTEYYLDISIDILKNAGKKWLDYINNYSGRSK